MTHSQGAPANVEWPAVAGGQGGMRYSPLKQINTSNVNQLQVAWTYDVSDGAATSPKRTRSSSTESWTGYTPAQKVFAGATRRPGSNSGSSTPALPPGETMGALSAICAAGSHGADFRRAFDKFVYSLDARTGKPDQKWGIGGRIDFRADLRGGPEGTAGALGHPPVIYKNLLIFGGSHRREPACCSRGNPRLRRADRQAALDISHHPASGRVRIRHMAEGCLDVSGAR